MSRNKWTDMIIELQSLSQAGLTYGRDDFDLERYARIRNIAAEVDIVIAVARPERHNTPHYAYGVCKIFTLCHVTGGSFEKPALTGLQKTTFPLLTLPRTAKSRCACALRHTGQGMNGR